jgi:SAM-dependent methyltransferase
MELLKTRNTVIYNKQFFERNSRSAMRSARPISALIYEMLRPARVVDVGCGRGEWLLAFNELGTHEIYGLDGDHVDRDCLLIDRNRFLPVNLACPFEVPGHYDLTISLEVAEHLPSSASRRFVRALTGAAPLVLFSAAIPGQDGNGHINLKWPNYWRTLFEAEGYRMFDPIRPLIRDQTSIEWWYRQNIFIYASPNIEPTHLGLGEEVARGEEMEWIHLSTLRGSRPLKQLIWRIPGAMWAWSNLKPWIR